MPSPALCFAPFGEPTIVELELALRVSLVDATAVELASDDLRSRVPTSGSGIPPALDELGEAAFDELALLLRPMPPFLDLARSFLPSCSIVAQTRIPCTQLHTS